MRKDPPCYETRSDLEEKIIGQAMLIEELKATDNRKSAQIDNLMEENDRLTAERDRLLGWDK